MFSEFIKRQIVILKHFFLFSTTKINKSNKQALGHILQLLSTEKLVLKDYGCLSSSFIF